MLYIFFGVSVSVVVVVVECVASYMYVANQTKKKTVLTYLQYDEIRTPCECDIAISNLLRQATVITRPTTSGLGSGELVRGRLRYNNIHVCMYVCI